MTFLNPAVLIGLIATVIPVILHFLNLRKIKKVEYSTLYFLKELKKSKIRSLKIKQWLLLLLRMSIIASLVLAFSKPAIENSNAISIGERAKKSVAIILDNSYSMAATQGEISNFGKAKKIAGEIFGLASTNDKLLLVQTSPVKTAEGKKAPKLLADAQLSYAKAFVSQAFEEAKKFLSEEKILKKELFVLSDFQKTNFNEKEINETVKNFDANTRIYLIKFNSEIERNLSLENISPENQILFPGKNLRLTVAAKNAGKKKTISKSLALFINNEKRAQKNVSVPPGKTASLQFSTVIKTPGFGEITVKSEDDEIPFDNVRNILLKTKSAVNIIISSQRREDAKFLEAALDSSISKLNKSVFVASRNLAQKISQKTDVLFSIGNTDVAAINALLKAGKTAVLFPSAKSDKSFSVFLEKLQLGKATKTNAATILNFSAIDYNHALFGEIFESKAPEKINSPQIREYFRIEPKTLCDKIIALEDNSPFLCEIKKGKGGVFLFAVPPDDVWSDFPYKPVFAPLVNRIALFAASGNVRAKEITAGEPYFIDIAKLPSAQIKIIAPEQKEYYLTAEYSKSRYVKFAKTFTPGFYYVYSNGKLCDAFAVNFDVEESAQKFYGDAQLLEIFGNNARVIKAENVLTQKLFGKENGRELWRIFLALALFLTFAEMFVAKTSKKDFEELNNFNGN